MKRVLANATLSVFAGWFALLDHCLIVTAGMPVSGEIVFLLLLQAAMLVWVMLLVNDRLEILTMLGGTPSIRLKLVVFVFPCMLLVISPVMISDSMYRARYGNLDKFVVHGHVGHDLTCCLNPFSSMRIDDLASTRRE